MKLFKWWDRRCSSSEQALRRLLGKRFRQTLMPERSRPSISAAPTALFMFDRG